MGRQAATSTGTGSETAAAARGTGALARGPKLELVNSSKRETILRGMLEAVGAEGYDGTSVRTVLDRTGLYRQAFYDNFPDKDSCYMAALELGIERLEAAMVRAGASKEGWRDQLRAGLGALLDLLDEEPDFGRGVIVEVHAAGPEALAKRAEAMKRAADFIDLARADVEGPGSPPPIAPEGIVSGIHAIVHSRLSTGATKGFRELLPEFMYFAVLPYFGAAAASEEMQAARV